MYMTKETREGGRYRSGGRRKGRGSGSGVSGDKVSRPDMPAPLRASPGPLDTSKDSEEESMRKRLTDCRHFLRGHCQHEDACAFRHKAMVANSRAYCERWLETGTCDVDCPQMHPSTATTTLTDCQKFLDPNSFCKKIRGHERSCQFRHNEAVRRNRPAPCDKWLYYSCRDVSCPRFHPLDRVAWMKQRTGASATSARPDRAAERTKARAASPPARAPVPALAPAPAPVRAHTGRPVSTRDHPHGHAGHSRPRMAASHTPHSAHGHPHGHSVHAHGHSAHAHGHSAHGHAGAYPGPRVSLRNTSTRFPSMSYPGPVVSAPSTPLGSAARPVMPAPMPATMTSMPMLSSIHQWDMMDGSPPSSPDSATKEAASHFSTPETSPAVIPTMAGLFPSEYSLDAPVVSPSAAPRSPSSAFSLDRPIDTASGSAVPNAAVRSPTGPATARAVEPDEHWRGLGSVLFSYTPGAESAPATWTMPAAPAPPSLRVSHLRRAQSECTHAGPCGSACLVTTPGTPLGSVVV